MPKAGIQKTAQANLIQSLQTIQTLLQLKILTYSINLLDYWYSRVALWTLHDIQQTTGDQRLLHRNLIHFSKYKRAARQHTVPSVAQLTSGFLFHNGFQEVLGCHVQLAIVLHGSEFDESSLSGRQLHGTNQVIVQLKQSVTVLH